METKEIKNMYIALIELVQFITFALQIICELVSLLAAAIFLRSHCTHILYNYTRAL